MTAAALVRSVRFAPRSRLELSDEQLMHYLRERDGDLPRRVPRHTRSGRCKYERYYPAGGCPWCGERAA